MQRTLPEGLRIRYRHEFVRIPFSWCPDDSNLVDGAGNHLANRMTTVAHILSEDGTIAARGRAICRRDEQFSKKIGRAIAGGRALKNLYALRGTH